MEPLAQDVLAHMRRLALLKAGDRIGVAVSGGADSVALLRLLLELRQELGVVLSAVHFNHQLRGPDSDSDERFVAQLARNHSLDLLCERGDVKANAAAQHLSTEAAARQLRYRYFRRQLEEGKLNCIATAHTLDDQAETVLLRVVRGAGTRGLAGIYPRLSIGGVRFSGSIIRPLLCTRREQLEAYLREVRQPWREDSSNRDLRHARNRVRHGIMPRLERSLNPRVREALAETAELARAEEEYWQKELARSLPEVWDAERRTVRLDSLCTLPLALQRRVVRAAGEALELQLEFKHVEEILGPVPARSGMLPRGWSFEKSRTELRFEPPGSLADAESGAYEYVLTIPGIVEVPEAGGWFEAALVPGDATGGYNPDQMFDPALLQKELTVRNWRAGDRFWPAHRKAPKKIKELLQECKLTGARRKHWPVVASGNEIVWVRGFPLPERFRFREGAGQGLAIREFAQEGHSGHG